MTFAFRVKYPRNFDLGFAAARIFTRPAFVIISVPVTTTLVVVTFVGFGFFVIVIFFGAALADHQVAVVVVVTIVVAAGTNVPTYAPPPPPVVDPTLVGVIEYAANVEAEHVYIVAIPAETVAVAEGAPGIPAVHVVFGSLVRPVVTNSVVPPCFTLTAMVAPTYPGTGISIMIGSLNLSPTLEIPNSRAPLETSLVPRPLETTTFDAAIAVASNAVPEAEVIVVPDGMVMLPLVEANTTSGPTLIVSEVALLIVPETVETEPMVPPVTVVSVRLDVAMDPVASAAELSDTYDVRAIMPATHAMRNCFFIKGEVIREI